MYECNLVDNVFLLKILLTVCFSCAAQEAGGLVFENSSGGQIDNANR
jgi:hypothetical protein